MAPAREPQDELTSFLVLLVRFLLLPLRLFLTAEDHARVVDRVAFVADRVLLVLGLLVVLGLGLYLATGYDAWRALGLGPRAD